MRVLALTLLAFALRVARLHALGDLEFDEIVSVRYASLSPADLLHTLSSALFEHPPLYYLLLGWWRAAVGGSDVATRFFSVLPGTLLVPLTYAIGRRVFGRRIGILAALLTAVAPLTVFYSREARMYGLVATLGVASLWLCLRALSEPRSAGHWLVYALVGLGGALSHYAGLLVVLAQPATVPFLRHLARRRLRPVLLAAAAVAAGAAGWALSSSGVRGSLPALAVQNLLAVPAALWQAWGEVASGPDAPGARAGLAALALLGVALLGVSAAWPRAGAAVRLLGTSLIFGVLALVFAVALGKPVQARYLLPAAPFAFVLVARGALARPRLGGALLGLACVAGALPFWADYYGAFRRADYSDITTRIATFERADDAILLTGPWQAWYFDYYYAGDLLHTVLPVNAPPALDPGVAAPELAGLAADHRRLWFVQAGLAQADPTNFVERWLRAHAWPALREAHQNAVLTLYALQPPERRRAVRPVDFGGSVRLAGGWVDGDEVPAADVARLWLEFQALRPPPGPLKVSVRLVGADGQRVASDFDLSDVEHDDRPANAWAPGETVGIRRGVWVPVTTNPQPYDVRLVVYDAATLEPLAPSAAAGAPLAVGVGGEAPVGGVYVTQSRAALPPPEGSYQPVDRTFGGGDDFDTLRLAGVRWASDDPSAGPLGLELLWRIAGTSGTTHRSRLAVLDGGGHVWWQETRPLFSGGFNMHDWRDGETLGERRTVDLAALPPGHYTLVASLLDATDRLLPVDGASGDAVALRRLTLPYQRPLSARAQGWWQRSQALLARLPGWPRGAP